LTACIGADGSALKPFVILPRETIDEEIFRIGYTPHKVIFFHHVHSFMTKRIFEFWMNNVFYPEIVIRRARFNYFGPIILLLDQFSGHNYPNLEEQCRTHNVIIKYLVPHSSHLCQPLDLITFAELKRQFDQIRCTECRSAQSNKIVRMMRAWTHSVSVDTIVSTFAAAGIVSQAVSISQRYYCTIDLSVSIHLKDLEQRIDLNEKLLSSNPDIMTPDAPSHKEIAAQLSQHRPFIYPPCASWTKETQNRIPLEKIQDTDKPTKKSQKNSMDSTPVHPSGAAQSCPCAMTQRKLFDIGVNRLPKERSVAGDQKSMSADSDMLKNSVNH
jgi:hypothetical protein